jgi:hypothetical protein
VFQLLYVQHGGSGLGLSLGEIMDLDVNRIEWLLGRMEEQREREAQAIQRAARRGGK